MPDGPDGASQFVRHGNRCFIVATPIADRQGPARESRERLPGHCPTLSGNQHGARAVREQAAEIHVAPFADAAQVTPRATGMFAQRQSQPTGKLSRASEGVDVSDAAHQRGRRQQADSGNRLQTRHDGIRGGECAQLALELRDARLKGPDPSLHWKRGASAMELAVSWELAGGTPRGLPEAVARVVDLHEGTGGFADQKLGRRKRSQIAGGRNGESARCSEWGVGTQRTSRGRSQRQLSARRRPRSGFRCEFSDCPR